MDTIVATVITLLPSIASAFPPLYGITDPIRFGVELVPTEHSWAVHGDGDSTIPYHGALGLTRDEDDRVYIIDGVVHGDLTNIPEVLGSNVPGLLQLLLEGRACSQPQMPSPWLSQNNVAEIV